MKLQPNLVHSFIKSMFDNLKVDFVIYYLHVFTLNIENDTIFNQNVVI